MTTAVATPAPVQPAGAGQKIGKYQILNELGKGATSAVFLALDPFANRKVAVLYEIIEQQGRIARHL